MNNCENCGEFNIYGACSNCEWQPNYDYFDDNDLYENESENEQNEDDDDGDEVMNKNIEIDETRITSSAA